MNMYCYLICMSLLIKCYVIHCMYAEKLNKFNSIPYFTTVTMNYGGLTSDDP